MLKRDVILNIVNKKLGPYGKLILLGYGGSISYGLNTPESDIDIKGIFIPNKEHLMSIFGRVEQKEVKDTVNKTILEGTIFALDKYMGLATKANPNILELMFLKRKHIIYISTEGELLIKHRNMFLSKQVKHSYGGYAFAQLQRLDAINEYVNQNKRRLARVKKYGYDVKNAMHLFRLLETGIEILTEGELYVERKDAQFLRAIMEGTYTLKQIREMANKKFDMLEMAYVNSTLPNKVDIEQVEKLYRQIIELAYAL